LECLIFTVLEDLDQRFRPILLSSGLDILWQARKGAIAVFGRLELHNLIRVAPFLDLENLGSVFRIKQFPGLLVRVDVHDEKPDNILSWGLGRGGRSCIAAIG
jgi:hypothetical protein